MKKEIWKKVPGREKSHIVNNYGDVRSVDRWVTNIDDKDIFYKGRLMRTSKDGGGYSIINLSYNGVCKYYTIHRLVWDVFGKKDRNGYDVDHKDEDKENNHISNLQLLTHHDNTIKRLSNTDKSESKVVGVHKMNGRVNKKWRTSIMVEGKRTHLGYYETVKEAKAEYERARKEYRETGIVTKIFKRETTGDIPGVTYNKRNQKWGAYKTLKGNRYHFGWYQTQGDAIKAYEHGIKQIT